MNERIVFMGTPDFAAHILEGLILANYNIVGVVTQPDKEFGRKKVLTPSKVKEMALKYNLDVITPIKVRKEYEQVLAFKPDLIICSAYGQIIPTELLYYPKYKCINTHGSILPKYRGGAPIQRAIINGEDYTGITIMHMNEKMDEGDILMQERIKIDINDTNSSLFNKLSDLSLKMLLNFLPKYFAGDYEPKKQDHSKATYAPNLDKEIEYINFNDSVKKVYDHIRGLQENPGCYFILNDKKYKIGKTFFELNEFTNANIFVGLENDYLRIDCNDGFIKMYEIKPEGKNMMDAKSFFNGLGRKLIGEKLG